MFQQEEVAEYYNTTQNHYEKWWSLKEHLSLHYGIWDETIKSHGAALENTNRILLNTSGIKATDRVLDAGCGVGGAAFYINKMTNAQVTGISLSEKQIVTARELSDKNNLSDKVSFQLMDFTNTSFPSAHFDVIWCCEAMCHAASKSDFLKECFRLLKKDGRLIISDYFLSEENRVDKYDWLGKWQKTWAMEPFDGMQLFQNRLQETGFQKIEHWDFTDAIRKTARRMYHASLIGALSSEVYNLLHPNVSRFAKTHYKSGYFQYKALRENLWRYDVVMATK